MAKIRRTDITGADLEEYLAGYSDFSFELRVLKMLRDLGLECEHGGLYEDPVTKKSREFDIRAIITRERYRVRLAAECKNVQPHFPVLVACVPRHESEAYHEIAVVSEPRRSADLMYLHTSRAKVAALTGPHTIYPAGEDVGKSTVQVGRTADGSITANDSALYEKWGQCLSSAYDLVQRAYNDAGTNDDLDVCLSTVVPFVVIPDGALWTVSYDESGNQVRGPAPATRCSCFVGKEYWMGSNMAGSRFDISHVEIVTLRGLQEFVTKYLGSAEAMSKLFPRSAIREAMIRAAE